MSESIEETEDVESDKEEEEREEMVEKEDVVLNERIIQQQTLVNDVTKVEKLELCFMTVNQLDGLKQCSRLRELEVTKTHIKDLSGLRNVSATLTSLCISEQAELVEIPSVINDLVNLSELFLQDNSLEHISNIGKLVNLKRLWLFSNKISKIEGISDLSQLTELMIQSNSITSLEGIEFLPRIEILNVSHNPIVDKKEIQRLGKITTLKSVWFNDPYFSACPIAEQPNYKAFALRNLKQIQSLDGNIITSRDRSQVSCK